MNDDINCWIYEEINLPISMMFIPPTAVIATSPEPANHPARDLRMRLVAYAGGYYVFIFYYGTNESNLCFFYPFI